METVYNDPRNGQQALLAYPNNCETLILSMHHSVCPCKVVTHRVQNTDKATERPCTPMNQAISLPNQRDFDIHVKSNCLIADFPTQSSLLSRPSTARSAICSQPPEPSFIYTRPIKLSRTWLTAWCRIPGFFDLL